MVFFKKEQKLSTPIVAGGVEGIRIEELENALAQEQQNVRHWEAVIDQRLGLH
jgi:hypothetical protein